MAQFLTGHPDIFMARKEMHVFGADLHFGRRFYRRDLPTYLGEFRGHGRRLAGEASVWYLFSTQAAAEIKQLNPEARILIMLREPSELIFSLFHEFRFDGNEHLDSFEEALAAEEDRRAGRCLTRRTYFAQGLVYRDVVRYTEQIQRYLDAFGPEQVQVTLYNDFAAAPEAIYRQTLGFLGLSPVPGQNDFQVINNCKRVRSSLLQRVLGDRWLRSTAIQLARRLPRPLFRALQGAEEQVWRLNTRFARRPPMEPALRSRLRNEFAGEVQKLSRLLGRDLNIWSSGGVDALDVRLRQSLPKDLPTQPAESPARPQPRPAPIPPELGEPSSVV